MVLRKRGTIKDPEVECRVLGTVRKERKQGCDFPNVWPEKGGFGGMMLMRANDSQVWAR